MLISSRARVSLQPQGDHIELHQKRHGKHLDHEVRKHEAREVHRPRRTLTMCSSDLISLRTFGFAVHVRPLLMITCLVLL
ncbi:hypothetical protein ZEAMMB73_Zm00001d038077 [Zea mays]|jgi:hypothetical protein|uniref:Uncharacterized protein n=1 Tax=Zea mays TaxID=4577 RepID=A0A1D6M304_MAIZE|nr:hypothetical protein ZEAMMB73_Zm00001d038077 [Zea mays]